MQIGCCCGWELPKIQIIKDAGYPYVELPLETVARLPEEEFQNLQKSLKDLSLLSDSFCLFFPGGYKLIGDDINIQQILDYTEVALARAQMLGGKTTVLGSGYARNLPEGTTYEKGMDQFAELCVQIGKIAEKNQIHVAVEPINHLETNFINTVKEGYALVHKVNHPNIRLLADLYHMNMEQEDIRELSAMSDAIIHLHIANPITRKYPKPNDGYDYQPFLNLAREINPDITISLEGSADDFSKDPSISYDFLTSL